MERHKLLLDGEVTLAHITEAQAARLRAYREYEEARESQLRQDLALAKSSLSPVFYDLELDTLLGNCSEQAGEWMQNHEFFKKWSDLNNLSTRFLWFEGIPGAGNSPSSHLKAKLIHPTKERPTLPQSSCVNSSQRTHMSVSRYSAIVLAKKCLF